MPEVLRVGLRSDESPCTPTLDHNHDQVRISKTACRQQTTDQLPSQPSEPGHWILHRYRAGELAGRLAAEYGVNERFVYRLLAKHGVPRQRDSRKLPR